MLNLVTLPPPSEACHIRGVSHRNDQLARRVQADKVDACLRALVEGVPASDRRPQLAADRQVADLTHAAG